jgi:hypothetical protein
MRNLLPALLLAAAAIPFPAVAQEESPFVGEYVLDVSPDVAGGLLIRADGRFFYGLSAGALDQRAEGRWEAVLDSICLTSDPKPVPPTFTKGEPVEVEGAVPTIFVSWPNGRGIAGVDFIISFDEGPPIEDYTQVYGWTMPEGDKRVPRRIEIFEPIHDISAPPFELTEADGGRLRAILTPNDFGVVDLTGTCLDESREGIVMHRFGGEIPFVRRDDR